MLAELREASRSDLAHRTGLSAATVSRIIDDLQRARIVRSVGSAKRSRLGRRAETLALNPRGGRFALIHLGGHANDVALADLTGEAYSEQHLPLIGNQAIDAVLDAVSGELEGLLAADERGEPLVGLGVATGGLVDAASGLLIAHDQFHWRDVNLRDWLSRRFNTHVAVASTFEAVAWHEAFFPRDGSNRHRVLFVNCSTIIGAGFATAGTEWVETQLASGQLGHSRVSASTTPCVCGRLGCLQAIASDVALRRRASELLGGTFEDWSIQGLGSRAAAGDRLAQDLFEERARVLAPVIALLANTLAPTLISLSHNDHAYREQSHERLVDLTTGELYPPLRDRIRFGQLGPHEPRNALRPPTAAIMRDFLSPNLDLRPMPRGRLLPVIGNGVPRPAEVRLPASP